MKIPSLANIRQYINAVMEIPSNEDRNASKEDLIHSHLKLVVSIAMNKRKEFQHLEDAIQDGNMALIKAAENYDSSKGVSFATYAIPYINYAMIQTTLDIRFPMKLITTKPLRKAFFNLSKYRTGKVLTDEEAIRMSTELDIDISVVRELEQRLSIGTVSLNDDFEDDDKASPAESLGDDSHEPSNILHAKEIDDFETNDIQSALSILNERELSIIKDRWFKQINDEDSTQITLRELGIKHSVSTERIRQIEASAFKKMKKVLDKKATQLYN
jgi:RNA polymerase sigma-32 factor